MTSLESQRIQKAKDGREYRIWSSNPGGMSGPVTSHLVAEGFPAKTLCGRQQGRMTSRWSIFTPKHDCQRCAKKAGLL